MATVLHTVFSLDHAQTRIRHMYEWKLKPDWTVSKYQNTCTFIWLVLGGERALQLNGKEFRIKRGDIIVIPSSTTFSLCALENSDTTKPFHYLSMGCDWKVGMFEFVQWFQFPIVIPIQDSSALDSLQEIWLKLLHTWDAFVNEVVPEQAISQKTLKTGPAFSPLIELQTKQSGDFLYIRGLFYQWCALIVEVALPTLPPLPKQMDARLEKACNYIGTHYSKKIKLSDISQHVFMSESNLRLLFKTYLKISPMNYVLHIRLQKAKERLIETTETVENIANEVGFDDVSYFSRFFRSREQMTPTEFRSSMSGKIF